MHKLLAIPAMLLLLFTSPVERVVLSGGGLASADTDLAGPAASRLAVARSIPFSDVSGLRLTQLDPCNQVYRTIIGAWLI